MALDLLEYQVFTKQGAGVSATGLVEIDLPNQVPAGETWRVDRIAGLVLVPGGPNVFTQAEPVLFVYDQINPPPAYIPVDVTVLASYTPVFGQSNPVPPLATGGAAYFLDADDLAAPITLRAGYQLACVFYASWANTPWLASVRIQYARFKGTGGPPQPIAL